ncbi:MAG: hypothetical protein CMI26_11780 [Opitutae bacterium]|jgi:hypothetical protein|nr:hypothetical protein [Opitutae bacterium]|tara:strand:- start:6265 stop:7677 length:1413 start_codon:yes stop_codon:yes gene_type:complete
MRGILKFLGTLCFITFGGVALEQLCYRFSESYASWRSNWVWKEDDQDSVAATILRLLPLSQWATPPTDKAIIFPEALAKRESWYAEQVLSYSRPLRDELYEDFRLGDDLYDFEVREVGGVKDMALPRLTRFATAEDVESGDAKRVGETLNIVNAILLHVLPPKRNMAEGELSSIRHQLEGQFVSLLERGVGCGIIYAANEVELISAVEKLRLEEATLSAHLFSWASGESAHHLAKAVSKRPELWSTAVFDSPDAESFLEVSPPLDCPKTLCLMPIIEGERQGELATKMIEWARAGRQNASPFTARMGGLYHLYSPEVGHSHAELAFGYAYLIDCLKHIGHREEEDSQATLSIGSKHSSSGEFYDHDSLNQPKPDSAESESEEAKGLFSGDMSVSGSYNDFVFPESPASFNCQILRDYRDKNPESEAMEDKDIILMLGRLFEENGKLEEFGKKDEVFLLYYKSLRELESSP